MTNSVKAAVKPAPRSWDLVLGGQPAITAPSLGWVLGGLEGAKRRLLNPDPAVRLAVIPEIPTYGEAGLDLLIEALQTNTEWSVRLATWQLLSQIDHPKAQTAIYDLSPFRPVGGDQGVVLAYRRGERDFSYADLPHADLKEASLGGCTFFQANLMGANLQATNCNGARFHLTDLRLVTLSGSKLSGADLQGADLSGASVLDVKCSGTNVRQVKLSETSQLDPKLYLIWQLQNYGGRQRQLPEANLAKADLQALDLKACCLTEALLEGVDLRHSNLAGANLAGADLSRADLRGADLTQANLRGAKLIKANLIGANLQGTDLSQANVAKANLSQADLTGAIIDRLGHSETIIQGLIFPDGSPARPWWW